MDHTMAVRTQHRKISNNIIVHRDALFEHANRFEMVRFDKTLAECRRKLGKI